MEKEKIILFETFELDISHNTNTVWLNTKQMANIFNTSRRNIKKCIKAIYKEKELSKETTTKKYFEVQIEGNNYTRHDGKFYSLDVILSVGYRVKSENGIKFRKWANKIIKDYLFNTKQ